MPCAAQAESRTGTSTHGPGPTAEALSAIPRSVACQDSSARPINARYRPTQHTADDIAFHRRLCQDQYSPIDTNLSYPSPYHYYYARWAAKYSDFAKCTTDFFAKDFPSGQVKVEARTSPRSLFAGAAKGARPESFCDVPQPIGICNLTSGQEFKVVSCRDLETGAISAEVRSTSTFSIGGKVDAKSVTSLSTGNAMCQQLTLYNPLIEGLKLDLSGSLQPSGGYGCRSLSLPCRLGAGKLGIEWVQPAVHASTYLEGLKSPSPAPLITSDISTRLRDIQLGLDFAYSPLSQSVERYSVGILLDRPREKIALQAAQGFSAFTAAYHQRFTEQLEVAYKAAWSVKTAALDMEVGARYNLFSGGFVKVCPVHPPHPACP